MNALHIHAGPAALRHLRAHGLQPADVGVVPGAAGGPKGLILGPLDRFLFGEWLPRAERELHLVGASIGAWRLASACLNDPVRAAQLAQIAAYLGPRGNFDQIDKGAEMRLGIFFKEKRDIRLQYDRWRQPAQRGGTDTRLDRLIPRLTQLHRTLLANSQAAELLLAQELAEIARYAARRVS